MAKIPLLLLSGLLCDARLWRDQVADLSELADPFVADLTLDDSFEAMARRALARMPERFAIAALSMGGYVAFAVLRLAPERVTRLALLDTSARPDGELQARRRRGLMALARGGHFRGVTPRLLPQLLHPDNLVDTALTTEVMAMAERVGRAAFIRQQAAILNRPDSRPDLRHIAVPTLVAVGEADQLTPRDRAQEIAAGIPGAALRVLEGCGHLPPMERPAPTSGLLRQWLASPPGAGWMQHGA
ncbi:MAG TPA: alpha/beta fold hydrolase [Acetobacteraceae bacterium]|nr:alpha/beta fold hydrolase [Acetobacteraceae bacterium]